MYLHLNQALLPIKKGRLWHSSMLSGRYKHMLAKEFKKVGLPPPVAKPPKEIKKLRDEVPKEIAERQAKQKMRIEKIKANLIKADEEILKYRQAKINTRPYRGLDRVVKELVPEFIELSKGGVSASQTPPEEADRRKEEKESHEES